MMSTSQLHRIAVWLLLASHAWAFQQYRLLSTSAPLRESSTCLPMAEPDTTVTTESTASTEKLDDDTNPRLQGLALQLDDGTRQSHSVAQNTAFVTGFFKGLSTPTAYRNLLTSLYFVYQAMEEEIMDQTKDPRVKALDDPELRRVDALKKDMDYFYGSDWESTITPSPATRAYVDHILQIQEGDGSKSYLMIAHQYTRYLGDLFGGQMMSGMATRSLDLPKDGQGVAFYQFGDIGSAKDFITDWYTRLNELDLTDAQKQEIVDEANRVFDLNIDILQELEGSAWKAIWTMTVSSLKEKLGWQ